MNIRLIAFDMDDTLLGANGEFPEINVRALRACAARGIRLALNSGRSFETLRDFACALGVEPFIISVNGARVDEGPGGPTLMERVYDDEHTRVVYEAMRASGLYYTVYTRGHTYMGNSAQRFLYSRFGHHYAHTSRSGPYVYEMVDDEERLRAEGLVHPYKFVALGTEHDARFQGILDAVSPLNMSVSSSRADNLEVMMPGVDKGIGARLSRRAPRRRARTGDGLWRQHQRSAHARLCRRLRGHGKRRGERAPRRPLHRPAPRGRRRGQIPL